jgi:U3 small nucleolar RNA-associated protein 23
MRLKKVRNARRRLAFYRATYGFQAPFNVLVDGTAVQTSINLNVSLDDEVPKVLGGRAQLLVPSAVLVELKSLGQQYSDAEKLARRLTPLPDEEAKAQSAAEALVRLVADGNADRYCVLTEDPSLQRQLAKMPGVPLLRFARERIIVEAPVERKERDSAAAPTPPSREKPTQLKSSPRGAAPAPAPARKRKKVKEPNPLSCKKKKTQQQQQSPRGATSSSDGEGQGKSRRRKRARSG